MGPSIFPSSTSPPAHLSLLHVTNIMPLSALSAMHAACALTAIVEDCGGTVGTKKSVGWERR